MCYLVKFFRKNKIKYLKHKQKRQKNDVFDEKKYDKALFLSGKQIFLVILHPKTTNIVHQPS